MKYFHLGLTVGGVAPGHQTEVLRHLRPVVRHLHHPPAPAVLHQDTTWTVKTQLNITKTVLSAGLAQSLSSQLLEVGLAVSFDVMRNFLFPALESIVMTQH